MSILTFDVGGMTCDACTEKVQHALNKLDGVSHAEVTLKPGIATVHADPQLIDSTVLASVISDLGYTAKGHAEETAHA